MPSFQILCVTMHQTDFSKIKEMNIHSDVVFANQADRTQMQEVEFEGHVAKMVTTDTRGVGVNRNLALMYADADICLFADDDVTYVDEMESMIVSEFEAHPDAEIIIFHLDTDDPRRKQKKYEETHRHGRFSRMPWGGCRIAFRLNAVKKANLWFTTLFGGGCAFPSGEDSMWLTDAKRAGLTFYVSEKTIGKVSFDTSTWFTGRDEKYFFAKGAYYQAVHPKTIWVWMFYFALRTGKSDAMPWGKKLEWMRKGMQGYKEMRPFAEFQN